MPFLHDTEQRVIGIDPGTAIVGFSVVKGTKQYPEIVDFGVFTTKKSSADNLSQRLAEIVNDLELIVQKTKPDLAIVEDLFFFKNQKTVISVAQGRGAILSVFGKHSIPVLSPTPLQVKQTVCGYGRADKKSMQNMVKKIYNLDHIPKPDDAADSLAIAWWGLS